MYISKETFKAYQEKDWYICSLNHGIQKASTLEYKDVWKNRKNIKIVCQMDILMQMQQGIFIDTVVRHFVEDCPFLLHNIEEVISYSNA